MSASIRESSTGQVLQSFPSSSSSDYREMLSTAGISNSTTPTKQSLNNPTDQRTIDNREGDKVANIRTKNREKGNESAELSYTGNEAWANFLS